MTEHDEWDITTSVGITALAVAAARAIDGQRADTLVEDPYAESFVRAAVPPVPMPTAPPGEDTSGADSAELTWARIAEYVGVRSRFFDDYFAEASRAGVDQVVLLAAGLDTRTFRLSWPAGTDVYEVDQPKVLAFKDEVLTTQGARSGANRHVITVDLREDWPRALWAAGFDPSRPTAWLAEGLLPYLPAAAERDLFIRLQELSPVGSRIALEHIGEDVRSFIDHPLFRESSERFGIDIAQLLYDGTGEAPEHWLTGHGWRAESSQAAELAERYGRPLHEDVREIIGAAVLLRAERVD